MDLDKYIKKFRLLHSEGKAVQLILDAIHPNFHHNDNRIYTKVSAEYFRKIQIEALNTIKYSKIDSLQVPDQVKKNIKSHKVLGMCWVTLIGFYYLMGMVDLKENPYQIRRWINPKNKMLAHSWLYSESEGILDITNEQIILFGIEPKEIYENFKVLKRLRGLINGENKIVIKGKQMRIGRSNYQFIMYVIKLMLGQEKIKCNL